jgi:hypothetical protein
MAFMAAALPYIAAAGATIAAYSSVQQGKAANRAAQFEAGQMEHNAKEARAASQRDAMEQRRRAEVAQSRALAVAAASGAGALDPTVIDLIGDIEAEGDLNARTALYAGEERGKGMEAQAGARRYEGAQARKAANMKSASTILSSASSFAGAFGGNSKSLADGYNGSWTSSGPFNARTYDKQIWD